MLDNASFNKPLALALLKFSKLTKTQYKHHDKFKMPKGFHLIEEFNATALKRDEKFGFIAESNDSKSIVIAFRGSTSLQDWLVDSEEYQSDFFLGGKVHHGFDSVYSTCRDNILDIYKTKIGNTKNKTLYITGHSLGAAIATLHALHVHLSGLQFKRIVMYNFASPRVGDDEFRDLYNSTVQESVRFVNIDDKVPFLPKTSVKTGELVWKYRHVKSCRAFPVHPRQKGVIHIGYNHSFRAYKKGIKQISDE